MRLRDRIGRWALAAAIGCLLATGVAEARTEPPSAKDRAARPARVILGAASVHDRIRVNRPHYCESRQSRCDLHLHVDAAGFDPLKGYGYLT